MAQNFVFSRLTAACLLAAGAVSFAPGAEALETGTAADSVTIPQAVYTEDGVTDGYTGYGSVSIGNYDTPRSSLQNSGGDSLVTVSGLNSVSIVNSDYDHGLYPTITTWTDGKDGNNSRIAIDSTGEILIQNQQYNLENSFEIIDATKGTGSVTINADQTATKVTMLGSVSAANTGATVKVWLTGADSFFEGCGTADQGAEIDVYSHPDSGASAMIEGNYNAKNGSVINVEATGNSIVFGRIAALSGSTAHETLKDSAAHYMGSSDPTLGFADGDGSTYTLDAESGTTQIGWFISMDSGLVTANTAGTWTGTAYAYGGTLNVNLTDTSVWNLTQDAVVTNLVAAGSTIHYPTPDSASDFTGTTITVNGDYSGNGNTITMNTVLGGDDSATDRLVIKGNSSGTTNLVFTNIGGTGSQTVDGIEVVEVDGTSDAVFTKPAKNYLKAGAYVYHLEKVGNNWYLLSLKPGTVTIPRTNDSPSGSNTGTGTATSSNSSTGTASAPTTAQEVASAAEAEANTEPTVLPATSDLAAHVVRPEMASYAANLASANTIFVTSLHDRLGETAFADALKGKGRSGNVWIRTAGGHTRNGMTDSQTVTRGNYGLVQLGGDVVSWPAAGQRMHLGLMTGFARQSSKTTSSTVDYWTKGKVSGFSGGVYATWLADGPAATGPYADTWLLYQRFKTSVSSGDYTGEDSYRAKGFTGSLEAGYTFGLKDWVSASGVQNAARLQLQGQVIRMGVRADSFVDNQGTLVEGLGYGNVRTRLGATLFHLFTNDRTGTAVKPYLTVNWLHDTKAFGTAFDTTENHIQGERNVGEVKLGVEGRITKNLNLWAYTGYQGGDHGYRNVEALFGVKALF